MLFISVLFELWVLWVLWVHGVLWVQLLCVCVLWVCDRRRACVRELCAWVWVSDLMLPVACCRILIDALLFCLVGIIPIFT